MLAEQRSCIDGAGTVRGSHSESEMERSPAHIQVALPLPYAGLADTCIASGVQWRNDHSCKASERLHTVSHPMTMQCKFADSDMLFYCNYLII